MRRIRRQIDLHELRRARHDERLLRRTRIDHPEIAALVRDDRLHTDPMILRRDFIAAGIASYSIRRLPGVRLFGIAG
jgi:hypothetical protein